MQLHRVLNSFVQPSHSGVPLLLLIRVLPYYICFSGFALLCHCLESTPVIQHQLNLGGRTLLQCAFFSLRCLWTDDVFSEPLFIKVASCLQNHKEYSDSLACDSYLTLHSSQWSPFTMPVIQEHILKRRIPCDE